MEQLMPRVKNGKFVLLPITDQTRGHGTHSLPAIWKGYLADFLNDTPTAMTPLQSRLMNSSSSRAVGASRFRRASRCAQSTDALARSCSACPPGARTLGMGNIGVASRDDDVLFFNPAQLVVARRVSAPRSSGTRRRARGGTLSTVTRFNDGGVGIGMTMADYDVPLRACIRQPRGTVLERRAGRPASAR